MRYENRVAVRWALGCVSLALVLSGCQTEPSGWNEWHEAIDEARRIEPTVAHTSGGVDLAALLGHRPSRLVSRHAHREWIKTLGLWGLRPLLVIVENSLRRVSRFVEDEERARFVADLLIALERRRSGELIADGFSVRARTLLDRDEVKNQETMLIAHWAFQLAAAEGSLYGAATPEQIGCAQGCVERTAHLEVTNLSSAEKELFGGYDPLWRALCWDNLEECRPQTVAAMLKVPANDQ